MQLAVITNNQLSNEEVRLIPCVPKDTSTKQSHLFLFLLSVCLSVFPVGVEGSKQGKATGRCGQNQQLSGLHRGHHHFQCDEQLPYAAGKQHLWDVRGALESFSQPPPGPPVADLTLISTPLHIRALRTVDQLVHKLEFEGPSISFSSRHLAVGVASLDTNSTFNGTTFSAVMAANASEPQVPSSLLPSALWWSGWETAEYWGSPCVSLSPQIAQN